MSKAKRLVAGSLLGIINFFATTGVSLFIMPFLIHNLGDRMYGLWLLLGSFFGFYGLLDLGLGSAVGRYVSRAIGTEDYEEANSVFNSSLVVFSIIGLIALLVSVIAAFFGHLFFKDPVEIDLFRKIILMTGFGMALGFPMRSFWALFASHLRYDLSIYIDLIKLAVRTGLIVFFIGHGYGLFAFAVIMFLTDVGGYVANFFVSLRIATYIRFSRKYIHLEQIKKLFRYSLFSFISQVSGNIKFNIDNFVIVGFLGLSSVTVYSIASRLISYYMKFIWSTVGLVMPVFSQFEGQNNFDAIREKLMFLTKISGYTAVLIGSLMILFGKAFIHRWVGPEYNESYNVMIVLVVPMLLALIQVPTGQALYGISKHKFLAVVSVVEAACNLILSLILVRHYGLIGVALGTAIPLLLTEVFVRPIYVCRVLNIKFYHYFKEIFKILVIGLGIFWIMSLALNSYILPTYRRIFMFGFIYSLIYVGIAFWAGFSKHERLVFLNLLPKKVLKSD